MGCAKDTDCKGNRVCVQGMCLAGHRRGLVEHVQQLGDRRLHGLHDQLVVEHDDGGVVKLRRGADAGDGGLEGAARLLRPTPGPAAR